MKDGNEHAGRAGVRNEIRDHVGVVTIERPERRNALSYDTVTELRTSVGGFVADDRVRCILLTGAKGAFCAGADLTEVSKSMEQDPLDWFARVMDELHPLIEVLHTGPKPVVTAIGGPVAGGGIGLALAGDIRIACPDAFFRSAYLRIGLSPDGASTYFLHRLLGLAGAQRFLLLDEPMSAEEARRTGLVHAVVAAEELEGEAFRHATQLAALPRHSVAAARALLAAASSNGAVTQMEAERKALLGVAATADAKEGIRAFVEKRQPSFEGLRPEEV